MILQLDATIILLEIAIVALFLLWFLLIRVVCRCMYEHGSVSMWWTSVMENKMYFACCRSKTVSHENLHDDEGTMPRARRPNPIIIGLVNHLREHHTSARDSAVAGCFGFSDSPPRYEDIYVEARSAAVASHRFPDQLQGVCNIDGTKVIMIEERISIDGDSAEVPPPSYEESVGMSSSANCIVTITIGEESQRRDFM